MTAKQKVNVVEQKPTAKKVAPKIKPQAPEPVEVVTEISQRDALLNSVTEAHALPTRRNSSEILPSPVILLDIEGMDVLASTAIASLGAIYMDASRAMPSDLVDAVAESALESHRERSRGPHDDSDLCCDSVASPSVVVRSWTFDVDAQIRRYGRTVAKSTQAWWANASPQAHAAASSPRYTFQPCLGDTLDSIRNFVIHRLGEAVDGLTLEDAETVLKSVRFVVRGSQYDAAALETLFQQVLDIRPAATPETAFADVPDPDTGASFRTIWFFRSVIEIRSYLDGYRSGLLAASGNRHVTKEHLDMTYKNAATQRRIAANQFAQLAYGDQGKSSISSSLQSKQTALALRASGGRHVGEFDSLYDALLILPTLNGSAARQFAESIVGSDDSDE